MRTSLEDLVSMAMFAHVAELRSISGAAEKLGVSKSVVSTRLKKLEEHLGVRLLQRTTRKLTLTEEGFRFFEHCSRMVRDADEAQLEVASSARDVRGLLRVSAPVTFTQMHLAPVLAEFMMAHPLVEVHLSCDDRMVDLLEGDFDMAIRITAQLDPALVARRLAFERVLVCAAPSYLERMGVPRTPGELLEHVCLRYSLVAAKLEWRFESAEGEFSVPVKGTFVANDGMLLRRMALAGVGLVVLPSFMVAADIAEGRLQTVLEPFRQEQSGIYAVYPHRRVTRRLRVFVDFLAERFACVSQAWMNPGGLSGGSR